MNLWPQPPTHRGSPLLAAHLDSLDLRSIPARERLEDELGTTLARKLLFALAPHRPSRRAA
jgi:hypothetical protein